MSVASVVSVDYSEVSTVEETTDPMFIVVLFFWGPLPLACEKIVLVGDVVVFLNLITHSRKYRKR